MCVECPSHSCGKKITRGLFVFRTSLICPTAASQCLRFFWRVFGLIFSKPSEIKSKPRKAARIFQFAQTPGAPFPFAAKRHGHIDDVPVRLPQQSQRKPANDALVIRVRRKNQRCRPGRPVRPAWRFFANAGPKFLSIPEKPRQFQNKISARIQSVFHPWPQAFLLCPLKSNRKLFITTTTVLPS